MRFFKDNIPWLQSLQVNADGIITGFLEQKKHTWKPQQDQQQQQQQAHARQQRMLERKERQLQQREKQLDYQQQQLNEQEIEKNKKIPPIPKLGRQQEQPPQLLTSQQQQPHQLQYLDSFVSNKDGKVLLHPDSQISMKNELLHDLKTKWKKNPKQVIRILLIDLIGKEQLKLMTRTGKNNRIPIPEDILDAIKGKITKPKLVAVSENCR